MESTVWIAMLIKPLVALIFLGLIVLPLVILVKRFMPEGKVKEFLFKERMPHWRERRND